MELGNFKGRVNGWADSKKGHEVVAFPVCRSAKRRETSALPLLSSLTFPPLLSLPPPPPPFQAGVTWLTDCPILLQFLPVEGPVAPVSGEAKRSVC